MRDSTIDLDLMALTTLRDKLPSVHLIGNARNAFKQMISPSQLKKAKIEAKDTLLSKALEAMEVVQKFCML